MQTAHNAWFRLYRISKQGKAESESSYQGPDKKKKKWSEQVQLWSCLRGAENIQELYTV